MYYVDDYLEEDRFLHTALLVFVICVIPLSGECKYFPIDVILACYMLYTLVPYSTRMALTSAAALG